MGNCCSKSLSFRSNPPTDPTLPASGDPVRPSPAMDPSLPTSGDDPVRPSIEPSLPITGDSVFPSPPMDPSLHGDSAPPPPMDSIESIREIYKNIDPDKLIGPLVSFIENALSKMNNTSEAGSSSSEDSLATVRDVTQVAARTIGIIATEADKLSKLDSLKAMGSVALKVMKGLGQLHWAFLGLSLAAFAIESYLSVSSAKNECKKLLVKILELAKDVHQFCKQMPEQKEKACSAIGTIVEGVFVCLGYLKEGIFLRYWLATTAAAQLVKTNQQLMEVRVSLDLAVDLHTQSQVTQIQSHVTEIQRRLPRRPDQSPLRLLDFKPVGFDEQVREVKDLLDMDGPQSALAVIVCGFGGVGKSTLAASVVQSMDWSSTHFKYCRVIIDETKADKTAHIKDLQQYIVYDLGGVKPDLQNPHEGRLEIRKALQNKCSFLFIDNVVEKDYIEQLLPKNFSPEEQDLILDAEKQQMRKLRILITSRDKDVQAELNMKCQVHEVATLSKPDSQRLLYERIVQDKVVEDDEKRMIDEVADACKGVPLLLSVFGKHLRLDRDTNRYQEALEVLREGNLDLYKDEDLGKKLMFVYHKIKDVEVQEAFLDICSYFHGWEWNLVADIVDSFKLNDLRWRMLVSKSDSDEVIVHPIFRLMGTKEARLTRFLNHKVLSDALEDNLDGFDLNNVKGISLVSDKGIITIQSAHLEAMRKSLRVLMLGDWAKVEGLPSPKAFTNLRYLRVGDIAAFPFKDPPKLDKLRVFVNGSKAGMNLSNLPPSLKRISHEVADVECNKFERLPLGNLSSLKNFIVKTDKSVELVDELLHVKTEKSVELPDELFLPASIIDLHLNRCKNLPKDIGHLTALESLVLDGSELKRLPQGFGELKNLKHLSMDYCSKLACLSEELGMRSSLEVLSMKGCGNLKALPESLGGLRSLQTLKLSECINLQVLPESFGKLPLQSLNFHSLLNIKKLPNSFGNMPLLKDLSLISCDSLMSLPKSFVQLKMLESLKIINCTQLSVLPKYFGRLRCLQTMTVEECHLLKELPHGFGALPALNTFKLRRCDSFVKLPRDFEELTSLKLLCLEYLPLISGIPRGFGKLRSLRFLYLRSCSQLKTLSDDFENMATLERLWIEKCPELDGAMMEKILNLQNCYTADILGSTKLLEKWENMHCKTEQLVVVVSRMTTRYEIYHLGIPRGRAGGRDRERAMRVALLHGKCMERNNATDQLMERLSLLVGLEEGLRATVALIMLPIQIQSHQFQTLQRFVETATERANTNGSGKLQIVCAIKDGLHSERRTATQEEERTEEEGIRNILRSLPEGSCAIPSSESRRVKILTWCCDEYQVHRDMLSIFMAEMGLDTEGRESFQNMKFTHEEKLSENVVMEPSSSEIRKPENRHDNSTEGFMISITARQTQCVAEEMEAPPLKIRKPKKKHYNSIEYFIKSTCSLYLDSERYWDWYLDTEVSERYWQSLSRFVAGDSKMTEFMEAQKGKGTADSDLDLNSNRPKRVVLSYSESNETQEFVEALKGNDIDHLLIPNSMSQVLVDDLYGKAIGFIICNFKYLKWIKLQHIYKHLQETDSNFIWIWIPIALPEDWGHGSYTRIIQCMPWATIPRPQLFNLENGHPRLVILDKHGQIANHDALPLLMGWGVENHLSAQYNNPDCFSSMESESCLDFLLHGMNFVGRQPMERKITFLCAAPNKKRRKMMCLLEKLNQIDGHFEVLYVGRWFYQFMNYYDMENFEQKYQKNTQNMHWPSLSFWDMIMFWYRCHHLTSWLMDASFKESNIMKTLHEIAEKLYGGQTWLVVWDNGELVTSYGYDMLQMICRSSDEIAEEEGRNMKIVKDELKLVKDELMESLSRGECTPLVKKFFSKQRRM